MAYAPGVYSPSQTVPQQDLGASQKGGRGPCKGWTCHGMTKQFKAALGPGAWPRVEHLCGISAPGGHLATSVDIFGGGVRAAIGISWVEARGAVPHPTVSDLAPNVNSLNLD